MSESNPQVVDAYLLAQKAPVQEIILDPNFGSVTMLTPVGRLVFVHLERPRSADIGGVKQPPNFQCSILLNPNECRDLYNGIAMVANHRWPSEMRADPAQGGAIRAFTGQEMLHIDKKYGGLQYPLRSGEETYLRKPEQYAHFRGLCSLNGSLAAVNARTGAAQKVITLGEDTLPCEIGDRFASGDYGRLQITFFAFPAPGKQLPNRGIGVTLKGVQFAKKGEKLASYDAEKVVRAGFAGHALPIEQLAVPAGGFDVGFGPNSANPGNVPPGVVLPFPQQPYQPPAQQMTAQPPANYPPQQQQPAGIPPQQPWQPMVTGAPTGVRPPGT